MSELGISEPRRRHKEKARAPDNTADNWDIKINIDSRTEENPRFSLDTSSTPLVHNVIPEMELSMSPLKPKDSRSVRRRWRAQRADADLLMDT